MYLNINSIKREITMLMVLQHYGITLRRSGQHRLAGACPLHHGDNPNAFQLDTKKNLFRCFTHCGGGSIFDFVMKKESLYRIPKAAGEPIALKNQMNPIMNNTGKSSHKVPKGQDGFEREYVYFAFRYSYVL